MRREAFDVPALISDLLPFADDLPTLEMTFDEFADLPLEDEAKAEDKRTYRSVEHVPGVRLGYACVNRFVGERTIPMPFGMSVTAEKFDRYLVTVEGNPLVLRAVTPDHWHAIHPFTGRTDPECLDF